VAEDSAAKAAPAAEESKGGNAGKPVLLYAIIILNMIGFGAFSWMFYQGKQKELKEPTLDAVVKGEHEAQEHDKHQEEEFVGKSIPLETFLVNLSGSRGRKLLKVNMELEVEGDKVQEEIEKRKPQVRDIIIILLSSKTYGQIASTEGKDYLKEEIRDTVNSFLTKGKIKRVMFTEFIYN
jgi:flagellar FliL protein